jgi:transposase
MPRGRKPKVTPEVTKKIINAILMGATYELAAGYAGIGTTTFYKEKANNAEFAEAIKAAEGAAAVGWLAKIEQAANDGTWQAAAWKLERRYPQEYGRTVVSTEQTGEVTVTVRYANESD